MTLTVVAALSATFCVCKRNKALQDFRIKGLKHPCIMDYFIIIHVQYLFVLKSSFWLEKCKKDSLYLEIVLLGVSTTKSYLVWRLFRIDMVKN